MTSPTLSRIPSLENLASILSHFTTQNIEYHALSQFSRNADNMQSASCTLFFPKESADIKRMYHNKSQKLRNLHELGNYLESQITRLREERLSALDQVLRDIDEVEGMDPYERLDSMPRDNVFDMLMQHYHKLKHLAMQKRRSVEELQQLRLENSRRESNELRPMREDLRKVAKLRQKYLSQVVKLLPKLQDEHTAQLRMNDLVLPLYILCQQMVNYQMFFMDSEEMEMRVDILDCAEDDVMQDSSPLQPAKKYLRVTITRSNAAPIQLSFYYFYQMHILTLQTESAEFLDRIASWWDSSDTGLRFPHQLHAQLSQLPEDFSQFPYGRPFLFLQDLGDIATQTQREGLPSFNEFMSFVVNGENEPRNGQRSDVDAEDLMQDVAVV